MLFGSLVFTVLLGLPLGVLLFLCGPRQMFEHKQIYAVLSPSSTSCARCRSSSC
jgi:D-methionine transport system permease protein